MSADGKKPVCAIGLFGAISIRPAGLYLSRRVSSAAYLIKPMDRVLLKWKSFNKMRTAGLAAMRDIPPQLAQPFISLVQYTCSYAAFNAARHFFRDDRVTR